MQISSQKIFALILALCLSLAAFWRYLQKYTYQQTMHNWNLNLHQSFLYMNISIVNNLSTNAMAVSGYIQSQAECLLSSSVDGIMPPRWQLRRASRLFPVPQFLSNKYLAFAVIYIVSICYMKSSKYTLKERQMPYILVYLFIKLSLKCKLYNIFLYYHIDLILFFTFEF